MTRRIRLGFRVALVAALTTMMTVSPASAGWLLNRLHCRSQQARCVTACEVVPCAPMPTCWVETTPQVCCPQTATPLCCGDSYSGGYEMPIDESHVEEPPAPDDGHVSQPELDADSPAPADEADRSTPPQAPKSPSDAANTAPGGRQSAQEEAPDDGAPEPVPTITPDSDTDVAPSPFDEPAPPPEAEADAIDEPFDAPTEPPATPPQAEAETDLFDELQEPGDDATPLEDAPGDDLFDGFDAPAAPADQPADAPAADPATQDLFDNLIEGDDAEGDAAPEPAAKESLEDIFGNPTSTEEEPPIKSPRPSVFDELFGQKSANGANGQATVADHDASTPVATVSIAATKSEARAMDALESRLWIDNTGNFSTEGRLIAITDDVVQLLKGNGRTCTVPLRRLSPSDAAYVAEVAAAVQHEADLVAIAQ